MTIDEACKVLEDEAARLERGGGGWGGGSPQARRLVEAMRVFTAHHAPPPELRGKPLVVTSLADVRPEHRGRPVILDDGKRWVAGSATHMVGVADFAVGRPVIFLDIDGVLNHRDFLSAAPRNDFIDRVCVARLNFLCDAASAVVVVTSSWRCNRTVVELQRVLEWYGFKGVVVGATPELVGYDRGTEILKWLDTLNSPRPERPGSWWEEPRVLPARPCSYVVLDDDGAEMDDVRDRFVKTDVLGGGLTGEKAAEALAILQRPLEEGSLC